MKIVWAVDWKKEELIEEMIEILEENKERILID